MPSAPGRGALLAATVLSAALAGCSTPMAELSLSAAWLPFDGDDLLHLFLELLNVGGRSLPIGPDAFTLRLQGPEGAVPLHWGDVASRNLEPRERVELVWHPRSIPGQSFVMSIDHGWGEPALPPTGEYVACIEFACSHATSP